MTPTNMRDLVAHYLRHRREVDRCKRSTITNYRYSLNLLSDCMGRRPLNQTGPWLIEEWRTRAADEGWSAVTIHQRDGAVRTFARWAHVRGYLPCDFTALTPRFRKPDSTPRFITVDQFAAVLDVCTSNRERLIVWLAYGMGLRACEVARANVEDWDRHQGVLAVHGKGDREGLLPVPGPVDSALRAYLAEHPAPSGPLIRSEMGSGRARLAENTVSGLVGRVIERAAIKAGPYDGVTMHGMRAAAITGALVSSGDVRVAQQVARHVGLANLGPYVRRAAVEHVRDALTVHAGALHPPDLRIVA